MFRRCLRCFSAKVEWSNGKRIFLHEGRKWTEYPMTPTEPNGEVVYYNDGGNSVFRNDLPFKPEEADPNVQMINEGFLWRPTNKIWKRLKDQHGYYYYNKTVSCRSPFDVPEMAASSTEVPEEVVEQPEPVETTTTTTTTTEQPEEVVDQLSEQATPAATEQPEEVTQQSEAAEKEQPDSQIEEEEEQEEVPAAAEIKPADPVIEVEEESKPDLQPTVKDEDIIVPDIEEVLTSAPAEEADTRPEPITEQEPELFKEEELEIIEEVTLQDEAKHDLQFDDEVVPTELTKQPEPEQEQESEPSPDERALAVSRALTLISEKEAAAFESPLPPSILNKIKSNITMPIPKMDTMLLDDLQSCEISISVEQLSAEDYAYRQEGLRGVLFKLAAAEYSKQAITLEKRLLEIKEILKHPDEDPKKTPEEKQAAKDELQSEAELVELTLKEADIRRFDYQKKSESAELLSIEAAAHHKESLLPRDTKRLLALPYNPFRGVFPLMMPSQASKALARHTANCLALSERLKEAHAIREILQNEASLSATVLESHQHLKRVIADSKRGSWDFKETKTAISKAKALAHYSSEAHNSYLFWNSMIPGGSPLPENSLLHEAITKLWGDYQHFEDEFVTAAKSMIGTGYIWLVYEPVQVIEKASIKRYKPQEATPEANTTDTPLLTGGDEPNAIEVAEEIPVKDEETLTQKFVKKLCEVGDDGELLARHLKIVTTLQSDSLLAHGIKPLFGVDMAPCLTFDDASFPKEEKEVSAGINYHCPEEYVIRFLKCVDWRRAEYQLRTCIPEFMLEDPDLSESSECLKTLPGEVLHNLWVENLIAASPEKFKDLKRPFAELQNICSGTASTEMLETMAENMSNAQTKKSTYHSKG